jgi:hypothetical protein
MSRDAPPGPGQLQDLRQLTAPGSDGFSAARGNELVVYDRSGLPSERGAGGSDVAGDVGDGDAHDQGSLAARASAAHDQGHGIALVVGQGGVAPTTQVDGHSVRPADQLQPGVELADRVMAARGQQHTHRQDVGQCRSAHQPCTGMHLGAIQAEQRLQRHIVRVHSHRPFASKFDALPGFGATAMSRHLNPEPFSVRESPRLRSFVTERRLDHTDSG